MNGNAIMRVSAKYNGSPTSCETDFDGEVEDYSIVVNNELGVVENYFETNPIIYPNPTNWNFSIDLGAVYNSINLSISDINGKIIQTNNYAEDQLIYLNLKVAKGVYIINIASEGKKAVIRLSNI
jgi:hypothetical protein